MNHFRFWLSDQLNWITDENGTEIVDYIARFESLDSEWERLNEMMGVEEELPHCNRSRRGPSQQYYDSETADLVAEHFSRDIARFGYEFHM